MRSFSLRNLKHLLIVSYQSLLKENYSNKHVLIRLIKGWMKALEEDFLVGSVLMDLSKALNCIPDDLLIAKLYVYVFSGKKVSSLFIHI